MGHIQKTRLLLVVNPISGGIDKSVFINQARELCTDFGVTMEVFYTTGHKDAQNMQDILLTFTPNKVVAIGGDGTVLFTATQLLNHQIPMGIIPLGSANGMATELLVELRPLAALKEILLSEITSGLDLIRVNDTHYLLHIGDVGINAKIVEKYAQDSNRGMMTYAKYFIEELQQSQLFSGTITVDQIPYPFSSYMVALCNARKYGTGIPLNSVGNPMDGVFELVLIDRIDIGSLIAAGFSKFDNAMINHTHQKVLTGKRATITFDTPQLLQIDGEVMGVHQELRLEMVAKAVPLISTQKKISAITGKTRNE